MGDKTATLAKASIVKLDNQKKPQPVKDGSIQVMFNPKELTVTKQINWNPSDKPKKNLPAMDFKGGGAASLKLQLYFDTCMEKDDKRKDVRKAYTDAIYKLTQVDPATVVKKTDKGRPPFVRFQWGRTIGFNAIIANVSQRFTLFMPDGRPVRAVLDVTFTQIEDELLTQEYPAQNPTSGGMGGEQLWIVREGDTLPWIAFNRYGNANDWRLIADANRLTRVRNLMPGTILVIPSA